MSSRTEVSQESIEAQIADFGREIWERLSDRRPSIFERRWWDDRILSLAMSDESIKVQMFRFVDVLPALRDHEQTSRHLQEYYDEVRQFMPWAARLGMAVTQSNRVLERTLALNARKNVVRMSERFIAGPTLDDLATTIRELRERDFAASVEVLQKKSLGRKEAASAQAKYLEVLEALSMESQLWAEHSTLDWGVFNNIPRANLTVRISDLTDQFRTVATASTIQRVTEKLHPILTTARDQGACVMIDAEDEHHRPLIHQVFRELADDEEFRDWPDFGIVLQAYSASCETDLQSLAGWVKDRETPIPIRLIKGNRRDMEAVEAAHRSWPLPVFAKRSETESSFEQQSRFLLENHELFRPSFGTHNLRTLSAVVATARELGVPEAAYELQLRFGISENLAQALTESGIRVRIHTPYGQPIDAMGRLVRGLLENPSNDSFLRREYDSSVDIEELLMNPVEENADSEAASAPEYPEFQNEPITDFSDADARDAMEQAIEEVESQLGEEYGLVINGRTIDSARNIESRNPARKKDVIGRVAAATEEHVLDALESARRAYRQWAGLEQKQRAEYLEVLAAEIRNHRFELAGWIVVEVGKSWTDADTEVAEAIDFCMYYAQEMRRLSSPLRMDIEGEENCYFYRPRGVAAVISSWNEPLAQLTGMTAAALVTGNTVVMKPAEQSPVIAAKLMDMIRHTGIPDGVVNYLPGYGDEIGPELVGNPDVDIVAFAGSAEVGLEVNKRAAETDDRQQNVRRVIAEMGGKNAIIVDDDADLDEAVAGVMNSAFGFSGQKSASCSRVIVLNSIHDQFVARLKDAVESLAVGATSDPTNIVGPIIDDESAKRIEEYIKLGTEDCTLAAKASAKGLKKSGFFIAPHVFTDVPTDSPLAHDEIFGPVLAVIQADDLTDALRIANTTDFALTGGMYSRSPASLNRARIEFEVGNLFLNREITKSVVSRQPFGGFQMSGVGSKAGGPDYLQQFMVPVTVSENTTRRGLKGKAESKRN